MGKFTLQSQNRDNNMPVKCQIVNVAATVRELQPIVVFRNYFLSELFNSVAESGFEVSTFKKALFSVISNSTGWVYISIKSSIALIEEARSCEHLFNIS